MVDHALRAHLEKRIMEHREYRSELFRGIYKKGEASALTKMDPLLLTKMDPASYSGSATSGP
jgi:hypothetical protein